MISMILSCGESNLSDQRNEPVNFKSIRASVRPVYKKTTYNRWDKDAWDVFRNSTYNWYPYTDRQFVESVKLRANLNEVNLKSSLESLVRRKDQEDGARVVDEYQVALLTRERSDASDYPDRYYGRTYKESIDIINAAISSNIADVDSYVLGESLTISLSEKNVVNRHVMSQKKVVLGTKSPKRFAFVVFLIVSRGYGEGVLRYYRYEDYILHMREQFTLNYVFEDIYYPQNTVVFDEVVCVLNDNVTLVNFYPSNMIESHEINDKTITLTMADYDNLRVTQVGHLFNAEIRVNEGVSEVISFDIGS